MPGPDLDHFPADKQLPKAVDVVVVGGGIAGASTALELAERGHSVLLCEKGRIGGEQSSRNWGWVRLSQRDPAEIPLMLEALRLWPELESRTGHRTGYKQSGILFTADTARRASELEGWIQHLAGHQAEARMVQASELQNLLPGADLRAASGLFTPGDGRAEPQWATHAIARAAQAAGASVMTGCAVRSLDMAGGQLVGVVTEQGRVSCSAVVVAGGGWSRLFLGNAGVALPQLKVLNSVLRTSAVAAGPEVALWADRFALRRHVNGGYVVASGTENAVDIVPDSFRLALQFLPAFVKEWRSLRLRLSRQWRIEAAQARRWDPSGTTPFEFCRMLDPEPSQATLQRGLAAARAAFPVLNQVEVVQTWGGMIDVTPDALPVISAVADLPGLFVSTGYSGHGFGIGPAAGRLTADLVTGDHPVVDPHPFRLSRFGRRPTSPSSDS